MLIAMITVSPKVKVTVMANQLERIAEVSTHSGTVMKRFALAVLLLLPATSFATDNPLVIQAKGWNVKQCMPAIKSLSAFVFEDAKVGLNTTHSKDADKAPIHSVAERKFSDGAALSLLGFTPTGDGKCPASYAQIFYVPEPCISQSKKMSTFEYQAQLHSDISLIKSGSIDAYLMPAGPGCVVVKQEVIRDGNAP
ncbi:MAG: hypothetical protein V4709_09310 [Pseudomonadota bacterium]